MCLEVVDIPSKASMQGDSISIIFENKDSLTNMQEIISPAAMLLSDDVTESAKVFTNTLKTCHLYNVQTTCQNSSMSNQDKFLAVKSRQLSASKDRNTLPHDMSKKIRMVQLVL